MVPGAPKKSSLNKSQVRADEATPKSSAVGTKENYDYRETRRGGKTMDKDHLKKILAGLSIAGLLSGAGISSNPDFAMAAESGSTPGAGGTENKPAETSIDSTQQDKDAGDKKQEDQTEEEKAKATAGQEQKPGKSGCSGCSGSMKK